MTRAVRVLGCAVAVAALLATSACSSGKSNTPATQAPVSYLGRKLVQVAARNDLFSPSAILVSPGTTVTWVNDDTVAHDVKKAASALDFAGNFGVDAAHFGPGARYSYTFAKAGHYPYVCTIHAAMTGSVTVQ